MFGFPLFPWGQNGPSDITIKNGAKSTEISAEGNNETHEFIIKTLLTTCIFVIKDK
jgi:hypothetical protein